MFIEDPLRLPLLTMEWIFAIISSELGLLFVLKYLRQEKQLRTSRELGIASFFFGLSVMWVFLIFGDYYLSEIIESPFLIWSQGSTHDLFISLSYLVLTGGTLLFSFSMEKYRKYLFKRFIFTYCFLFLFSSLLVLFFINFDLLKYVSFSIWPLILLFMVVYLIDFFKIGLEKKSYFLNLLKFVPAFVLLALGFYFSTDLLITIFGFHLRLGGSLLQLISLGLLLYFFSSLPPLLESDWKKTVQELYVINRGGLCLFYRSFTDKNEDQNEHLKSGALASINIILESLIPSEKIKITTIKKKGESVIIYSGKLSTGVIVSQEELNLIKYNLKIFIDKFETIYSNVLLHFTGDTEVFYPVNAIVRQFFL